LFGLVRDDTQTTRDRIKAAEVLLAYGFARPLPDELQGDDDVAKLSLEAARALIARARATRYSAEWGDGSSAA
jgi:hypothetical protein